MSGLKALLVKGFKKYAGETGNLNSRLHDNGRQKGKKKLNSW